MTNSQRLAAVRRYLDRWLEQHHGGTSGNVQEAVLIRDGFYAGRQFRFGSYQAVWFIEEDELKIRHADGSLLACVDMKTVETTSISTKPEHLAAEPVATIPLHRAVIVQSTGETEVTESAHPIRRAA